MTVNIADQYKLSKYEDYGSMGGKEHIHLVRDTHNGKICVKKEMNITQKEVLTFRKRNTSEFYPELYDVVELDGKIIIVEEYIQGVTLSEYMMGEPLPESQAVDFAMQICQGLLPLHHAEPMIVYRDLKADNIMVTADKSIKLIDFNISRKVQEGKNRDTVLLGTAGYAAPEQFGYFQTDNRTDIYSFGVLLNYMLTAKLPIDQMIRGKYADVVRRCMEMEPSKRYQRIEDVLHALQECHNDETQHIQSGQLSLDNARDSWVIPGFRTKKWYKMIIAILGYLLLIDSGFSTEYSGSDGLSLPTMELWINRLLMTTAMICCVFYDCNYREVADKYKIFKVRSTGKRILEMIIMDFGIILLGACVVVLIETILGI